MVRQRRFTGSAAAALALPALVGTSGALLAALPATPAQAQAVGADLKVLSPKAGDALGSTSFALDVSFQSRSKSPVVTAELWVDGVRWAHRDLDTPQTKNVLSFAVDASTLSEGVHAVVVKVFSANGAVSTTQVNVQAGNNAGVSEGSFSGPQMKFLAPINGKRVSGTVDINMDAPAKNGTNPYVTFYVDKQFKTLKNYPPYNYSWDTTTVANGYHTVEATGFLEASNASTTRRVTVYVDNAGGATEIKTDIPDLSEARKQAPVTSGASHIAATVKPLVLPTVKKAVVKPAAPVATAEAVVSPVFPAYHAPVSSARPALSGVTATAKSISKPTKQIADARFVGAAPVALPMGKLPAKTGLLETALPTAAPVLQPTQIARTPAQTSVALPSRFVGKVPTRHNVAVATPRVKTAALVDQATHLMPGTAKSDFSFSNHKTFMVAFDGQKIAFDVQPRVEAGLPLAPFRQIFEHTGGQVMWVPETRVVRAVNADREIVISVGKGRANVNGQSISLAKPAFIEKGRTIVPLSFVGAALDVDVKYDAATGRLQITSK